ncbi:hypothetical protein M2165_001528 [Variovorax sp. TBS-050B]|nr:hypothetical protein [Variovorax sp. TBS-050B]
MDLPTPEAAFGRLPLEGAPPVARQSRFHGSPGKKFRSL